MARFQRSPAYHKAVRDVYDAQPAPVKTQLVRQAQQRPSPVGRVILRHASQQAGSPARREAISPAQQAAIPKVTSDAIIKLAKHVVHTQSGHPELLKNLQRAGLIRLGSDIIAPAGPLERNALQEAVGAPVLKILEQTTRPVHAIAGAAHAALTGGDVLKAGLRGLENKDHVGFGQVLKDVGAPKAVQGVGGFIGDVALDPTTYVTFGAGTLAKKAAEREFERVQAKALQGGMSREGATTVALRAAKVAGAKARPGKGLSASFAGREVPGVTRGTAAVGRGVRRAAARTPTRVQTAAAGAKDIVREVRPQLRPPGTPEEQFLGVRRAGRAARAQTSREIHDVLGRARGVAQRLSPEDHAAVIDAIERRMISKLPDELRPTAKFLRDEFRHAKRIRKQAGIAEGTIRHYFPHSRSDILEGTAGGVPVESVGRRTIQPGSSKTREERGPLSVVNPAREARGEPPHSTNVPLVYANYGAETAKAVNQSRFLRSLATHGRPYRAGAHAPGAGEAVYHLGSRNGRYGIREVTDRRELARVAGQGHAGKGGQYVILNKRLVDDQLAAVVPAGGRSAIGGVIDRATGGFKRVATATPGFHARNLVGDTQMGYLGQPAYKLPGNMAIAGRALRRLSQRERAQTKTLGRVPITTKTVKVAGQPQRLDEFIAGAEHNGVIRGGYIGRELEDLRGRAQKGGVRRLPRAGTERIKRWLQNREDLLRLATYKHALDRGMSQAEAADVAASLHIDYGDLTQVERKYLRRAFPFYTFSARALPIHAKALIQTPGKFANIEKLRENVASATGLDLGQEQGNLRQYQSRQAPFILRIGGQKYAISDSLPLNLLNELPTSADPGKYLDELGQFTLGLLNPAAKDPLELYANRSFFFRNDIESANAPLVSAPSWVKYLPADAKKKLGVTASYVDKRTGKKTWGWRGKADYIFKSVPGPFNLGQQLLTPGTSRRGQGLGAKLLSGIGGVKSDPIDAVGARIDVLYKASNAVGKNLAALRQQGVNAKAPTAEYSRLLAQQKQIDGQINALSAKRGDVIPLKRSAGRKTDPLAAKYGLGGGPNLDSLSKKYGLHKGTNVDDLAKKYGLTG